MNFIKAIKVSIFAIVASITCNAQTVTLTKGGLSDDELFKNSKPVNFNVNGNRCFISKYFKAAEMHYFLRNYDPAGNTVYSGNVELTSAGSFNNSLGINNIIGIGNNLYALVENLDKGAGKNTLTARLVDKSGKIADEGTKLMEIPFEKMMNSGFNYAVVSPSDAMLATIGELPYEKGFPAKFKIALYDKDLKKVKESEIAFSGENTKNKNISVAVADNGTVYMVKKTSVKNGEMALTIYQCNPGASEVKEYSIELTIPNNYPTSFAFEVNVSNELILVGTYYERKGFSAGEKAANGGFFFTNKGLNEKVFKTFAFDKPIDNLTAQKVLINGNTIFLFSEQFKEEKAPLPPGTPFGAESDVIYTHKSNFVTGFDTEGNKKFQMELQKDFTARNADAEYYGEAFICNEKLTVIYNDLPKKYISGQDYGLIPVLVQITNDGLMGSPVIFKNELKFESYNTTLYPTFSVQDSNNQISFLTRTGQQMRLLTVKIE